MGDGQYLCYDRVLKTLIQSKSVGGLIPIIAQVGSAKRQGKLLNSLNKFQENMQYGVPSHDPSDRRFDKKRYWKGPIWLIVNYFLIDGMESIGRNDMAKNLIEKSLEMV